MMGLRDKIRGGIRKRLRKGKQARSADSRQSPSRLRRMRAKLDQLELEALETAEQDDREAKDQFARAQNAATAGAPLDASLDPSPRATDLESFASGGAGRRREEPEETMEDFVVGSRHPEPSESTFEDFAMFGSPIDDDDGDDDREDGLLHWGDE